MGAGGCTHAGHSSVQSFSHSIGDFTVFGFRVDIAVAVLLGVHEHTGDRYLQVACRAWERLLFPAELLPGELSSQSPFQGADLAPVPSCAAI